MPKLKPRRSPRRINAKFAVAGHRPPTTNGRHSGEKGASKPHHYISIAKDLRVHDRRPGEALEALKRGVEKFPEDALLCSTLGKSYFFLDQIPEAINSLETSLELNPDDQKTQELLQRAKRVVASIEFSTPEECEATAKRYKLIGAREASLFLLEKGTIIFPDYQPLWLQFGQSLIFANRRDEAATAIDIALDLDPEDSAAIRAKAFLEKPTANNLESTTSAVPTGNPRCG